MFLFFVPDGFTENTGAGEEVLPDGLLVLSVLEAAALRARREEPFCTAEESALREGGAVNTGFTL